MSQFKDCPHCGSVYVGSSCPQCASGTVAESPERPPSAVEPGKTFHGLEILEVIGAGGMGVVYKARQPALDRMVALKVLPSDRARAASFQARFEREARLLASLSHPNIVTVHDFGQEEGSCFLVMEFVEGTNLRAGMTGGKLPLEETLRVIGAVCDGLEYAHGEGVIHRDIKPENILIDSKRRVKIADFGLAKLVERDATIELTQSGVGLGTPRYMAPEQMEKAAEVDRRADIYSLGVMLYEMLTGELPVGSFEVPSKKSSVHPHVDAVVLKALSKDPAGRYSTVAEFRTELTQASSTAVAVPKTSPKKPRFLWAAPVAILLLVGGLVFALRTGRSDPEPPKPAPREQAVEQSLQDAAIDVRGEPGVRIFMDGVLKGITTSEAGGLLIRNVAMGKHALRAEKPGFRTHEEEIVVTAGPALQVTLRPFLPEIRITEGDEKPDPALAKTGATLIVRTWPQECAITCPELGWDKVRKTKDRWVAAAIPEGEYWIAFCTADGELRHPVQLHVGKKRALMVSIAERSVEVDRGWIHVKGEAGSAISLNRRPVAAVGAETGELMIKGLTLGRYEVHAEKPGFEPQDAAVAVTPGEIAVVTLRRFRPILRIVEEKIRPSAQGSLEVLSVPPECSIECADLGLEKTFKTRERWGVIGIPPGRCAFRFGSGERALEWTGEFKAGKVVRVRVDFAEGKVHLLSPGPEDFEMVAELPGHGDVVAALAFRSDGTILASGGLDKKILLWDVGRRQLLRTISDDSAEIHALAFSPDGGVLASGGNDGGVRLWNGSDGKPLDTLTEHKNTVFDVRFTRDGRFLISASADRVVIWDAAAKKLLRVLPLQDKDDLFTAIALSPDGKTLVSAARKYNTLTFWDMERGERVLSSRRDGVCAISFSPDGGRLAVGTGRGSHGTLSVADLTGREHVWTKWDSPPAENGEVECVVFSPDGRLLVSGAWQRVGRESLQPIRLWNATSGESVGTLAGHRKAILCFSFRPDGQTLASGGGDKVVRLWSAGE